MIDLTGNVALVTGSSRGIGAACAIKLAEAGADIVLNYCTSRTAADSVAEQIVALGRRVAVVKADVAERDDIESLVDFIEDHFGRLDIVVSNAASGGFRSMMSITEQNFIGTMKTNVLALIQLVQVASRLLEKSPGRAKVIGLSSHGAAMAVPMYGCVGGSKAALESFARHLALEFGERGINVNIVRAGLVATDSTTKLPYADMMFEGRKWRSMTGDRFVEKEDVANAVLFLASPLSDMVQGETLTVDCGAQVHV